MFSQSCTTHKELVKENDDVMSVSERRKHSTCSDSMRTLEFIYKVKQTIDENRGQRQKSCMCLKRQSEGGFMKTFDKNHKWWREINLFKKKKI